MTHTGGPTPHRSLHRWFGYRLGIVPLPLFVPLAATVAVLAAKHAITSAAPIVIAVLAVGGFACAWLGGLIPWIRRAGGPALTAAFLPSYLVSQHWIPDSIVASITSFAASTQFIYVYITAVIVGSILGMNRAHLLDGILKIFAPLLAGSVIALVLGSLAGLAAHVRLSEAIFLIVVPVMAGGVGEGVLPLSTGYAEIRHVNPGIFIARLLPVVLFGNLVSIVLAGLLNSLGRRCPQLTGNGNLQPEASASSIPCAEPAQPQAGLAAGVDLPAVFAAVLLGILLYLLGAVCQLLFSLPAPLAVLVFAVLLKLTNLLPRSIDAAAAAVGHFFTAAVTYPLLFAVAVALTPWTAVLEALHPANLLLVTLVVSVLVLSGFLIGKLVRLYPIEAALINACHSGAGGTGAVAILTASERMELMPFAQIATRIGGAITVALALLAARYVS